MIGRTNAGGGGRINSIISVTYPEGSTCTAVRADGKTLKARDTSGTVLFNVDIGTWTVTCTDGTEIATSDPISITATGQSKSAVLAYAKIYGIRRDITAESPLWTRTDDSASFTATATVGTVAGSSDFDNCYPWSDIKRVTLSTDDVMVWIPKFWFRRYRNGDIEYIQIADKACENFTLHPAFTHGDEEKPGIFVGAYKTSSNNKSVSGASPQGSQTITTMRTNARAKGDGWGLIDISTLSAIQMLILVEFANNDVQSAIGQGYTSAISTTTIGGGDNVLNLTGYNGTNGSCDVVWRGIEALWGRRSFIDGINLASQIYYISNDPTTFDSTSNSNYKALNFGYSTGWSHSYITQIGLDDAHPEIMLPTAAGSGSSSTFFCDSATSSSSGTICFQESWSNDKLGAGLFSFYFSFAATGVSDTLGSRLSYIPQSDEEVPA